MSETAPMVALLTNNDDDIYCFRKELIEAFIGNGYRVLISCPYGEKFTLMKDVPYIYDDPVIDRRGTSVVADTKLLIHYISLFRKYRPAVVLAYTAKPNVYGSMAAHLLGIPVINNVTGFGSVLNESAIKQKIIMGLFKFVYRQSDCIMFQNSTNMKLAVTSGMVTGKDQSRKNVLRSLKYALSGGKKPKRNEDYFLLPGSGVNTDRFSYLDYPKGGNGKSGERIVFNYIGRILKDKGVDDYIEAAKRIHEEYPETEFNMLGFIEPTEIHYEKELKDLEKEGIVYYRGSQKDVRPFIERAHAIIHPSTYGEGMSNVLLENASSGRPIITTDNPGCKETVNDGRTGMIYHGGNVDELTACIKKFLSMPNSEREKMGRLGRKRTALNFSRQIVIDIYLDEIGKLIQ
ncbi:MAG: glycosyltransferase family 4 protein [Lachnospiraceae bacterium]|nr:glycosyltransferase family 4 protein [Lachnospiraceae bacterium]